MSIKTQSSNAAPQGVILLNKPKGMTSQRAVTKVKKLYGQKKAGHTGTLDPMATGVLPICLGHATKFSHYQLNAAKAYRAIIQTGIQTDTGDADGQAIQTTDKPDFLASDYHHKIQQCQSEFLGQQTQIPPMYSALKHQGKKLYELAREGKTIVRPPRCITIHQLSIQIKNADQLEIEVICSKGTYIRVLAEDICRYLGTIGHLITLQRTQVGDFMLAQCASFETLEQMSENQRNARLLPLYACANHLPHLNFTQPQAERVLMGQRLNLHQSQPEQMQHLTVTESIDVLMFYHDFCLGLGVVDSTGRLQPKKVIPLP